MYIYIYINRSHTYDINKPEISLDMDRNKVNIKSVSVWWCFYVLSNTEATFEALKNLSNTEAEMKKSVAYKKTCNSSLNLNKAV